MSPALIRQEAVPQGTSGYLREYHRRLTQNGIDVTLPTARADFKLPPAMELKGTPLSEVIRSLRASE